MDSANTMSERILDVAQDLVQTRGYHAFSYRDIAGQIGIKTASIHYYYPSKGDLGEAILNRVYRMFGGALQKIGNNVSDPAEKLRKFAGIFIETFDAGDRLCPFCMMAAGQDAVPEEIKDQVRKFWLVAESWLIDVINEGERQGRFRVGSSPEVVARTLISTLEGSMVTARAFEDPSRLAKSAEYMISSIETGY